MSSKLITATELKAGSYVIIRGPCVIRKLDISKTGRHGHTKVRIEAVGLIDGKKRVVIEPGHNKLAVPLIEKRKGQILSINEKVSVMDIENYETIEIAIPDELKNELKEGIQVEYWNIEGQKIIKRVVG